MEAKEVYYHDCRVLGKHARLPRGILMTDNNTKVAAIQHKCPFCSRTAGELITDPEAINKALIELAEEDNDV